MPASTRSSKVRLLSPFERRPKVRARLPSSEPSIRGSTESSPLSDVPDDFSPSPQHGKCDAGPENSDEVDLNTLSQHSECNDGPDIGEIDSTAQSESSQHGGSANINEVNLSTPAQPSTPSTTPCVVPTTPPPRPVPRVPGPGWTTRRLEEGIEIWEPPAPSLNTNIGSLPSFNTLIRSLQTEGSGDSSSQREGRYPGNVPTLEVPANVQKIVKKENKMQRMQIGSSSSVPSASSSKKAMRGAQALSHEDTAYLRIMLDRLLAPEEKDVFNILASFGATSRSILRIRHSDPRAQINIDSYYNKRMVMQAIYFWALAGDRLTSVDICLELQISPAQLFSWIQYLRQRTSVHKSNIPR